MISPTTVTAVPLTGLLSMDEVTVVTLQGCAAFAFLPISAAGAEYVPLVGFDQSGKRILDWTKASEATTSAAPAPNTKSFFVVFDIVGSCCLSKRGGLTTFSRGLTQRPAGGKCQTGHRSSLYAMSQNIHS